MIMYTPMIYFLEIFDGLLSDVLKFVNSIFCLQLGTIS